MTGDEDERAKRCRAETELYNWGRAVAEFRQCKVRTRHPSGLCHHHRSDDSDSATGTGQLGAAIMGTAR